jgi:glycosyltransferase involved in cell wall biosynthesis
MIVDPSRFICGRKSTNGEEKIITYCGKLEGDKDGVSILIKSFSLIYKEFPYVKLQILGSLNTRKTRERLYKMVEDLKIKDRVIFKGFVNRDLIPEFLCNSDILALARPANKQAEGGFPTKLGEYLATGNPVVVTKVGEISDFLIDNKNAFLSDPDSPEKFADKLREAITNINTTNIGLEGKKLVYHEFHYLTQAKVLEKFISDIIDHD